MSDNRQLNIRVNLDTGSLERDAASATQTISSIGNEAEQQGQRLSGIFSSIGSGIAATFALDRIKSFISEIINVRSEVQSLGVSFETMLGDKQKADELMGQIRSYAASTPMQVNDLAQGAQTLLGFNIEAKKVMPIMQALGDISMGNRDKFNSLTLSFAQMSATGKLMGQDLMQMINAGFNPLTVMSEQTGKSISQLKDEMGKGAISAQMVEDAFIAATAEGGKFHGMLEQQSHTLRGSISNLQGAFSDMLNDFGESSEGIISAGINAAYEMVKNYRDTGEALMALIATVGVYKAAVIANQALDAAAVDTLNAKIVAVGQVNAAKATGLELEIQEAVTKGALTQAEAEQIMMQYELAKARVADLSALKTQMQAELVAAQKAEAAAAKKLKAAEAQQLAAIEQKKAALLAGDGFKVAAAQQQLDLATTERNTAAKQYQASIQATSNAQKEVSIATTNAETAAQELNTLSMNNGSRAAGFLTVAKKQLRNTVAKLYATMTAHPYAMIAAAVAALAYGVYKLCTYQTDAQKRQKRLNDTYAEAQGAIAAEQTEIRRLFDALKKAKKGSDEYNKAKNAILSKYGKYLKSLGSETDALKDQAKAYALVAKKAREAALAKYRQKYIESLGDDYSKKYKEGWDKIKDLVIDKFGEAYWNNHKEEIGLALQGRNKVFREQFIKKFDESTLMMTGADYKGDPSFSYVATNPFRKAVNDIKKANIEMEKAADDAIAMFGNLWGEEEEDKTPDPSFDTSSKGGGSKSGGGGSTGSGDDDNEAEKAAQLMAALQREADLDIQQIRERRDAILKYEAEKEQARINILEEGIEKRHAQRERDMALESDDIKSRMQQEIDAEVARQKAAFEAKEEANAAQNKKYVRKTFKSGRILATDIEPGKELPTDIETGDVDTAKINAISARYGVLYNLMTAKHVKSIRDQQKAERLALDEYLKQYGTYEEKKTAIAAIYAEKRAKAANDAERMQITREESKALSDVELDNFMNNKAALAFGNIDTLTGETLTRLIAEMEDFREQAIKTFDAEKIKKYDEALANLRKAEAKSSGGLFGQFLTPAYFKERQGALIEINTIEKTHNDLLKAKEEKEKEVADKIQTIKDKVKELTGKELSDKEVTDGSTVTGIIGDLYSDGKKQEATDLMNLNNGLSDSRTQLGQVTDASNKAGVSLSKLKESFASKFTGKGGTLATVEAIVHGINDIVQAANNTVKELASTADALGADTSVGSGWDKAQTFIQGFADASAGATEAFDAFKSGNLMGVVSGVTKSFTSWIKAFAAIHDASRERTIQQLQDEIEELERINRRVEHNLESQYSKQASTSYDEEIKNLEKQRQLIAQQIAAENDKKKTDDDRVKEWQDQYEELGWQIEEYKDKALDAILGEDISSSIDNFADKLAESWGKVGERAKAAKDYVKTILKQMVMEAMKTDLSTPIRKLREMMAKALDDDVVSEREQAELEAFAQQLAEETERKYQWADRIMNDGADDTGGGTTGTFATASQDSITELSGRAAAIHTSGEMRRELLLNIGVDVATLKNQVATYAENTAEIRELQLLAVGHLETIAKNTNELYEMNERLDKIERNTRGL